MDSIARLNGITYTSVGSISGFATGWTHIVGMSNGSLLFYNASTGNGFTSLLDSAGTYTSVTRSPGFATGGPISPRCERWRWSLVVGALGDEWRGRCHAVVRRSASTLLGGALFEGSGLPR